MDEISPLDRDGGNAVALEKARHRGLLATEGTDYAGRLSSLEDLLGSPHLERGDVERAMEKAKADREARYRLNYLLAQLK